MYAQYAADKPTNFEPQLFSNTRSVTFPKTISLIQSLHMNFPNPADPKIRHVLLLTVFCSPTNMPWSDEMHNVLMPQLLEKLVDLRLIRQPNYSGMSSNSKPKGQGFAEPPETLSRDELIDVLLSPFTENERSCIAYARDRLGMDLDDWEILKLKGDVAAKCLPISSKVCILPRLHSAFAHNFRLLTRSLFTIGEDAEAVV